MSPIPTDTAADPSPPPSTRRWLDELAEELGRPGDEGYALRVLRGFLHTLRNRLPVAATAHFATELPESLRGIYYERWQPTHVPVQYRDAHTFWVRFAEAADLASQSEAAQAAEAAIRVVRRHVTDVELAEVKAALPPEIAALFEEGPEQAEPGAPA